MWNMKRATALNPMILTLLLGLSLTTCQGPDAGNRLAQVGDEAVTIEERIGTTKVLSCAWMAGKKEFSAGAVKALESFFQMFSVPDGESGQSCGVLELEGHQYGAGPEF